MAVGVLVGVGIGVSVGGMVGDGVGVTVGVLVAVGWPKKTTVTSTCTTLGGVGVGVAVLVGVATGEALEKKGRRALQARLRTAKKVMINQADLVLNSEFCRNMGAAKISWLTGLESGICRWHIWAQVKLHS